MDENTKKQIAELMNKIENLELQVKRNQMKIDLIDKRQRELEEKIKNLSNLIEDAGELLTTRVVKTNEKT